MSAKADRNNAERACEHYCREVLGCVVTVRAVRTQWQRQDLFAGDVIGKTAEGHLRVVQATAGKDQAVTARRRKLERIPWHPSDRVQVVQLRSWPDPANRRRLLYGFRVHEWEHQLSPGAWGVQDRIQPVPREWFKSVQKESAS